CPRHGPTHSSLSRSTYPLFLLLPPSPSHPLSLFFFNHTAPPEIYPLSLHDALPICTAPSSTGCRSSSSCSSPGTSPRTGRACTRSEEHTSELQSLTNLVCRLLLEKKKKAKKSRNTRTAKTAHTPPHTTSHHTASTTP